VNGREVSNTDFRKVIGFVDQEDTLMSTLTVYETILYSVLLRLARDMSIEAKKGTQAIVLFLEERSAVSQSHVNWSGCIQCLQCRRELSFAGA